jgi:TetR/AcrR family tetracycline transcriptional repressor
MPLDRNDVLQGALDLVNDEGVEGLTMRRLAERLGVKAGALYWHFADKQALYDAIGEHVMTGLLEPPLTGEWDVQLAEICRRIARNFLKLRDSAQLATRGLRPGPEALAASEKMLAIAHDAGFSKEEGIWATSALGYYVLGWVTDTQATEAAMARGLRGVLKTLKKTMDRTLYPRLAELGDGGLEQLTTAREFRARFDFGLDVIMNGLRASLRDSKRARAKQKSKPRRRR